MNSQFKALVFRQLNNMFLELSSHEMEWLDRTYEMTYARTVACADRIALKYFDGLKLYHSGQYAMFLYYYSRELSIRGNPCGLADRLYYLNKILHGLDVFHSVSLPEYFYWEHPVGTVLGNAEYKNGLVVYQCCTIGGVHRDSQTIVYPKLGENVMLFSHASIIGECTIGDNVTIASNSHVKNQDIPSNSTVFGVSPNLTIREDRRDFGIFRME